MADEETGEEVVAETAPAPAPAPAEPVYEGPFPHEISTAQLGEVWAATSDDEALALLARCLQLPDDYEEDARTSIWVDMVYKWLDFCKTSELAASKALAFLRVMVALHIHAVDTKCTKAEAYGVFTDGLLSATKALPKAERFSLPEAKLLTEFANTNYLSSIKLHQLVYTEEQTVRPSHVELFLQTPAAPTPTADAIDPDAVPPPAEAEAPADDAPPPPPEPAPEPAPELAPAPAPAPQLEDEALTAAISATITSQVEALKQNMAAEYAQQEQEVLDRIAQLETRLK